MALSFGFKTMDTLNRLHEMAKGALAKNSGAPEFKLVNHSLDPENKGHGPRASFQAHVETGSRPVISVAPPSALVRELTDWSSPEAVDLSAKAALLCCEAYAQAARDSGALSAESAKEAKAALRMEISRQLGAAREALSLPDGAQVSAEGAKILKDIRALVSPAPSQAEMAAARFALGRLKPEEQKAVMIESDIVFGAKQEFAKALAATEPPVQSIIGLPSFGRNRGAPKAFILYANGSFSSREHSSSDNPVELARAIAAPNFNMPMEHMVHRHYLATPDGEVHGEENIVRWARDTLRLTEAFEIAQQTEQAPAKHRATL